MIVTFTKDWNDVPTCTTHVLREMAKTIPVLWVNSIGTRKPRLSHPGHLGRVVRRLLHGLRPAVHKENNLRVLSPILIPKAQSGWSIKLNRVLMNLYIRRELRKWGDIINEATLDCGSHAAAFRREALLRAGKGASKLAHSKGRGTVPIEYWCFVPNAVDLLPEETTDNRQPTTDSRNTQPSNHPIIIYYCVDDWSKFHNLDRAWLEAKERELLQRADIVFTPARYLAKKCRGIAGDRVHHVPHGVEYAKFRAALSASTLVPSDIVALPHPIVGFYGNLYPWIDFGLIESLAKQRPAWSFVIIGPEFCDVSDLKTLPNVHFLGRREHNDLPAYCAGFNAAMIPYDVGNPRMASVNPVKTRELLAAGVPVVAADIPELHGFGDRVKVCRTLEEWIAALEEQVARTDRDFISRSVAGDDWTERVKFMRGALGDTGRNTEDVEWRSGLRE